MSEANYPPEILEAIRSALEPGESILAIDDFTFPVAIGQLIVQQSLTAVLTEHYIHYMTFKRASRKGGLNVTGHAMIPVSKVSTVSTVEGKKMFGPKSLTIIIFWDDKQEVLTSKRYDDAMEFANILKRLSSRQEMQHGLPSIADELEKLAQLTQEGILTNEELTRAKEMFLGRPQNAVDQSMHLLRNLNELKKQGVLSEMEFNMKKWDILAKKDLQ